MTTAQRAPQQQSFLDQGRKVDDGEVCPNIFAFCTFMAAVVAARRGGTTMQWIKECYDFMGDVVGSDLGIRDPLPCAYDWTVGSARECALEMLEYDS